MKHHIDLCHPHSQKKLNFFLHQEKLISEDINRFQIKGEIESDYQFKNEFISNHVTREKSFKKLSLIPLKNENIYGLLLTVVKKTAPFPQDNIEILESLHLLYHMQNCLYTNVL